MNLSFTNSKQIRTALLLTAAMTGFALPAFADEGGAVETVTVTGSRIVHANLNAPTAVTTVDDAALKQAGTVNVADMLRTVPSFGVSGLTPTNSAFLTSGAGISTLQLRNLGEQRTLVLVDGKRYVSGVPTTGDVDFNTIPTDQIDRIEVVTGGSSAVYGSDAIAGVINVILKTDFQGVNAHAQYGISDHGDSINYSTGASVGSNFDHDKGNVIASISWSKSNGVKSAERENTRVDDLALCVLDGDPTHCATSAPNQFSSFSAYGWFRLPSGGPVYTVSSGTGPTGTVVPFSTATYGFNRQAYRTIETPVERLLFSTNTHYDVSNNVQLYAQTMFANTSSSTSIEPFATQNSDLSIDGIDINNPFVPAALRAAAIAAGDTTITYRRRLLELGPRHYDARRDTYRMMIGAKGKVFGDFNYDTFFSWGHTLDTQSGTGQFNAANFREALNAVVDGSGAIVCANPAAVEEGCVPINLFGLNSISPAAAKYIAGPQSRIQNADEKIVGATLGGPVYSLPAGDVQLVGGVEYRQEFATIVPDALTQAGQNGGNKEAATRGGFNVVELFGETEVPLLKDMPFVHELTAGGAFRWSEYNTQGDTEAYSTRLSWSPIDDLRFRAQYARAIRAPNIEELFSPGGEDFAAVADPCDGVTAATPGDLANRCRAVPAIANRIAATGSFTLSLAERQGTGGISNVGNLALTPEKSDSYQVGSVFTHDFGDEGALTASVDYYAIRINNVITTLGRQETLDLCFSQGTFPNPFCDAIVRQTTGPAALQGAITEVNSGFGNLGLLRTQGIDFAFTYSIDLDNIDLAKDMFGSDIGQLAFRSNWSWVQKHDRVSSGETTNNLGSIEYPFHKVQAAAVYTVDSLSLQWETTYIGNMHISRVGFFKDAPVKANWTHNLSLSYDVNDQLQLFGGIDNLFDTAPPNILSGVPDNTTGTDTDAGLYDPIGRHYFFGARIKT